MTSVPSAARAIRPRPPLAYFGIHRLLWLLAAMNAAVILATWPFFGAYGLRLDWSSLTPSFAAIVLALVAWLGQVWAPGKKGEWPVAESMLAFVLIAICCVAVTPAQYLAVALNRPLADPWLARADAWLGISVPDAVRWTGEHPLLVAVLRASYQSLIVQFAAPILLLGIYYRDRAALWEYTFNFHLCLVVTLLGLALFPAMCAFSYYGFESLIDQTVFIRDFNALRAGTFTDMRLKDLEGLITFPSFHVAGGLIVTWVFRRHPWLFGGLVALNALMIASTILLGPHYAVDIIASTALVVVSAWIYSRWASKLIEPREQAAPVNAAEARPLAQAG